MEVKYTMYGSQTINAKMRKLNERHKQITQAVDRERLLPAVRRERGIYGTLEVQFSPSPGSMRGK